ncbi:Beta-Adrenergic Receptor Kinase 2 [Manis pentadactyla]|nr:Beta-Adrenergic Receptor Kinase 2 [Manis pentadactyla]
MHLEPFRKDKRGSSYFRTSLGQLGSDQKPQAEETRAPRVGANRGREAGGSASRSPPRSAAGTTRLRTTQGAQTPLKTLRDTLKGPNPTLKAGQENSNASGVYPLPPLSPPWLNFSLTSPNTFGVALFIHKFTSLQGTGFLDCDGSYFPDFPGVEF